MITHTFSRGWNNGGSSLSKSVAVESGAEINIDESVPALTTDKLVAFAMDVSQLKGLYVVSNQDVLIQTNDGTTPDNVITLEANVPFVWALGDAPLRDTAGTAVATDITELYITNAHATLAALVQIRALYDPTV